MRETDLNNMDKYKVTCRLLQLLLLSGLTFPIATAQQLGELTVQSKHQLEFKGTVAMPEELKCLGFIHEALYPLDILVSGTEQEGLATFLMEGSIVFLNGPGLKSAKAGDSFRVVRTEAKIRDRLTQKFTGYYYKELGTIKIASLRGETATGTVVTSCDTIFKGDFLLPQAEKTPVKFTGEPANRLTPYPEEGLASSIVLGRNDLREMAAGHFCFIGIGTRDGVKLGDRFTIYRVHPPFDPKDLIVNSSYVRSGVEDIQAAGNKVGGVQTPTQYDGMHSGRYRGEIIQKLKERSIPHRVMGDLVVVEAGETTSAAMIINSRFEIHLGDVVVRR
jgi:hypothetical protein